MQIDEDGNNITREQVKSRK